MDASNISTILLLGDFQNRLQVLEKSHWHNVTEIVGLYSEPRIGWQDNSHCFFQYGPS